MTDERRAELAELAEFLDGMREAHMQAGRAHAAEQCQRFAEAVRAVIAEG